MKALSILLACALALLGASSSAQSAPPASASAARSAAPANPHAAPAGAARNPHAGTQRPVDQNAPARDLPVGTIEATIVDAQGVPQAGIDVRLGIMTQSVAEGESRSQRLAKADASGKVRFDGLKVASGQSYRVTVRHAGADYASTPFPLSDEAGQRVLLHVYPATSDIDDTMIGVRGFVYIEPRDDVFQFEVLFRVFNMGTVTWLPKDVVMRLPKEFKAFRANESMNDTRFEALEGKGAKLSGTFTPGQHDLSFRFQTPKSSSETASFDVGLPPRVAEIRVIAEASTTMGLEVDGFEPVQADVSQNGKRVLVTRKVLASTDTTPLGAFTVGLTGLPVPGQGRWVAVLIALAVAVTGVLAALGRFDRELTQQKEDDEQRRKARELLLAELVEIERHHRAGELGPRAYGQARDRLLDAMARIGAPSGEKRRKQKPKRARERPPEEPSTA